MNRSVLDARLRLLSLKAAVFARAAGQAAVRTYIFLLLLNGVFLGDVPALAFLWLCLSAVPAFAVAPLIGGLAGSRYRRALLVGVVLLSLGVIVLCTLQGAQGPWPICLGALAVESAFFAAGRQTLVPIAARQARVSLPRVQGLLLVALALGELTGIAIALQPLAPWPSDGSIPNAILTGLVGYAVAALALVFVRFRGEGDRGIAPGMIRPFIEALTEIIRMRSVRRPFLALGGWLALWLLFLPDYDWLLKRDALFSFGAALVTGIVIGGWHFHAYRVMGLLPCALLGLLGCAIYNLAADEWASPVWASGILLGVMVPPLLTGFQAALAPRSWGHASAILFAWLAVIAVGFAFLLQVFRHDPAGLRAALHGARFGLVALLTVFGWWAFLRPVLEWTAEVALLPLHRIKAVGPGFAEMPWKGPCLVIANHGAMLDPLWIAKYLPLPTTPMMTSKFYDLPVISFLMRKVVGTIRVPDMVLRREAPEIQEAIAALDRGDCVVIFPEGWLRRKDEVPLRRFGRGAWQILKARPQTPVFAFWIEGNWGSFFSWRGGKLMGGKPMDIWRRITIAGLGRRDVDAKTLESHLATRALLMQWVLEARALLGLPPIESVSIPSEGEGEDEKDERKEPGKGSGD